MSKQRKLYIRTFGCAMNVRDSEALTSKFLAAGYELCDDFKEAGVICIVTCSVREGAENRAVSFVRSLSSLKKNKGQDQEQSPVICFLGCAARNKGEEIKAKMPHVDIIAGPSEIDKIMDLINLAENRKSKIENGKKQDAILALEDRQRQEDFYHGTFLIEEGRGQVVISTGCNNWCTYCIVPYVRGQIRHRTPEDIIAEVKRLVANGVTKLTLLGQNVNDYPDFISLLKQVSAVEGVEEIDFTSSHPKNQSKELFKVMNELPNVKKHLHMAIQSGSTKILKAMNRGYSKEQIIDLVTTYKSITNGTIGTDIIIGFPGETEEDFQDTVDIVKTLRFDYAYIFMYSPRPHSKAYGVLDDDVPMEVKKRRHSELLDIQKQISNEIREAAS